MSLRLLKSDGIIVIPDPKDWEHVTRLVMKGEVGYGPCPSFLRTSLKKI